MRTSLSVLLLWTCCVFSFAQITYQNNALRSGDEIIKQQVEYKDPGRSGENVIWDFSKLTAVNKEYKLFYSSPYLSEDSVYVMGKDTIRMDETEETDLIIGTEHYTNYFYRVKDNRLLLLGHQNPVSRMHNQAPVPVISYPMSFGQKTESNYFSKAVYSGTEDMYVKGNVQIESDATGILVLPNKDTLNHVSRIKTIQTIEEIQDSLDRKLVNLPDSIRQKMWKPALKSKVETYRWYVKGYRYPVFETVNNINMTDTTETVYFSTAFFYPPQEHYYLDDDIENLAVLDSLNNIKDQQPIDPNGPSQWLRDNFTYNYGPNPVTTELNIEYHLSDNAKVGIEIHSSIMGLVRSVPAQMRQPGLYNESFSMSNLMPGTYILRFLVRDEVVSNVILKK